MYAYKSTLYSLMDKINVARFEKRGFYNTNNHNFFPNKIENLLKFKVLLLIKNKPLALQFLF